MSRGRTPKSGFVPRAAGCLDLQRWPWRSRRTPAEPPSKPTHRYPRIVLALKQLHGFRPLHRPDRRAVDTGSPRAATQSPQIQPTVPPRQSKAAIRSAIAGHSTGGHREPRPGDTSTSAPRPGGNRSPHHVETADAPRIRSPSGQPGQLRIGGSNAQQTLPHLESLRPVTLHLLAVAPKHRPGSGPSILARVVTPPVQPREFCKARTRSLQSRHKRRVARVRGFLTVPCSRGPCPARPPVALPKVASLQSAVTTIVSQRPVPGFGPACGSLQDILDSNPLADVAPCPSVVEGKPRSSQIVPSATQTLFDQLHQRPSPIHIIRSRQNRAGGHFRRHRARLAPFKHRGSIPKLRTGQGPGRPPIAGDRELDTLATRRLRSPRGTSTPGQGKQEHGGPWRNAGHDH